MNFSLLVIILMLGVVLPGLFWLLFTSQKNTAQPIYLKSNETENAFQSSSASNKVELKNDYNPTMTIFEESEEKPHLSEDEFIFTLKSHEGKLFRGYELLQSLHDAGFVYESDQFFHY